MKDLYERTNLEIIELMHDDAITTSFEEDEFSSRMDYNLKLLKTERELKQATA